MKLFLKHVIILVAVFVNLNSFAANPPNPGIVPAPGSPIDDNVWILIAISIFYGTYKLYKYNKKRGFIL
jgi:hypothetical protein